MVLYLINYHLNMWSHNFFLLFFECLMFTYLPYSLLRADTVLLVHSRSLIFIYLFFFTIKIIYIFFIFSSDCCLLKIVVSFWPVLVKRKNKSIQFDVLGWQYSSALFCTPAMCFAVISLIHFKKPKASLNALVLLFGCSLYSLKWQAQFNRWHHLGL